MKRTLIILLFLSTLSLVGVFLLFKKKDILMPDTVSINDTVMTVMQSNDTNEATSLLKERLTQFYRDMDTARKSRDIHVQILLYVMICAYTLAVVGLILYCDRIILAPFRKLKRFAQSIASGNLDVPLGMDRHGIFGAFTESFDIMRVELQRAQENERQANQSKKELVASLSHDIKTPIASIKAVTELMLVKSPDNAGQLDIIMNKADQIDLLITNMFHATLEELEQLKVEPTEIPSTDLYKMIRNADYNGKINSVIISECVITADKSRLQQVFDNIINNSYKYAGTDIQISSYFEERYLAVEVTDAGPGVSFDELPLIFEKFYRGSNTAGKNGSGLGLYIAKHLMGKMNGDIQCRQHQGGFTIKILLSV